MPCWQCPKYMNTISQSSHEALFTRCFSCYNNIVTGENNSIHDFELTLWALLSCLSSRCHIRTVQNSLIAKCAFGADIIVSKNRPRFTLVHQNV